MREELNLIDAARMVKRQQHFEVTLRVRERRE